MQRDRDVLNLYLAGGNLPKADQPYDFFYDACYSKGLNVELRRLPSEKAHDDIFQGKTHFKGFVLIASRGDIGLCRVEISGRETINNAASRAYQMLKQKNIL